MFETGNPVTEDAFIGWEGMVAKLTSRIQQATMSIEINALPRTGKTSLLRETIRQIRQTEWGKYTLFVEYACKKTYTTDCFSEIVTCIETALDEHRIHRKDALLIRAKLEEIQEAIREGRYVSEFPFLEVMRTLHREYGMRLWIIIDEADRSPENFGSQIETLQQMLSSTFYRAISTSLRPLTMLFPTNAQNGSKYPMLFESFEALSGFPEPDIMHFRTEFERKLGGQLQDDEWNTMRHFCGANPYFLALFCNEILRWQAENDSMPDIHHIQKKCAAYNQTIDKWKRSLDTLDLYKAFSKWPLPSITDQERLKLIYYGLICDERAAVPFFWSVVQENVSTENGQPELARTRELIETIDSLLNMYSDRIIAQQGRGIQDAFLRLNRLRAIRIKTDAHRQLLELGSAMDIAISISEDEVNAYFRYSVETRNKFEEQFQ